MKTFYWCVLSQSYRPGKLFQTEPKVSDMFFTAIYNFCLMCWLMYVSFIDFFLSSCAPGQCLTCVCVWWRWRAFHLSSWWWSCHTADLGIPPPSSGTKAAASLWPSCRLTGRSPECRKSERVDGAASQRYRLQSESFSVIFEKSVHIFFGGVWADNLSQHPTGTFGLWMRFFLIYIGQMLAKIQV